MQQRNKVVAFDLDGTLVDAVADIATALNAALHELGMAPLPVSQVRRDVGHGALVLMERALAHRERDTAGAPALLARYRHHYQGLIGETFAFDGIHEVLAALKPHARLAVATNKPGQFARPIVAALFPDTFDLVLGPDDVGVLKPDPQMLVRISAQLGEVVTFVGDSAVDLETARRAGVVDVGVLWGLRPEEAESATHVARAPVELDPILTRLLGVASAGSGAQSDAARR